MKSKNIVKKLKKEGYKIYLKDYQELALELAKRRYNDRIKSNYPCKYNFKHVTESLKQYMEGNLYYNIRTGKTHFKNMVISEYSNPLDIPKSDEITLDDIIWDLLDHVFSSANAIMMYGGKVF